MRKWPEQKQPNLCRWWRGITNTKGIEDKRGVFPIWQRRAQPFSLLVIRDRWSRARLQSQIKNKDYSIRWYTVPISISKMDIWPHYTVFLSSLYWICSPFKVCCFNFVLEGLRQCSLLNLPSSSGHKDSEGLRSEWHKKLPWKKKILFFNFTLSRLTSLTTSSNRTFCCFIQRLAQTEQPD